MKKKVLFFINTLQGGGAERVLVDMVNNMDSSKYEITVQTLLDIGNFKTQLEPYIKYKSIIKTENNFLRRAFSYTLSFLLPPKVVYNLFIKDNYDYEVAFLEGIPTHIISASSNKKALKYAWVHTDVSNNYEIGKVYSEKGRHIQCYEKFDKIVCVSKDAEEGFKKTFKDLNTLCVKYNVFNDIEIKNKANNEDLVEDNTLTVVAVGRFEKVKGFDRLLKVHKRLINEGLSYKLNLVGDGSLRGEFEEYVKTNCLSNHTQFLGFKGNPYPYIKQAGIVVIPSRAEGFSTVACESVILGKPIVMTKCSGAVEILGDSEFGIVAENTEAGIYDGMKKMITDENLRREYSNKALIRGEQFSMESMICNIQQLFE